MVTDINNDIQLILISGYNKTFWNINFLGPNMWTKSDCW